MLNIVCHHKNRLVLFCQIVEVDSLISWFKCSVWLQSQTKLVETLCPKGSDLWCFASLKERQNKAFLSPLPLHMLTLLWHWLSYYCIPVKKQQTPQLWMEEGGEGCGLLCSPKLPQRSKGLQHCFNMVSNGYNIAPTLQRSVALKIVPCNIILKGATSNWWVLHIYFLNHAVCFSRVLIWWFINLILHWRPWMTGALNNMERYIYPKIRKITV